MLLTSLVAAMLCLTSPDSLARTIDVRNVRVAWDETHELLPDIESLETVGFQLRRTPEGLAPAVTSKPSIRTDLGAMARMGGVECTTAALNSIAGILKDHLEKQGFMGVTVNAMQLPIEGREASADIYFLAHLPIDGGRPNASLPSNLVPVGASAAIVSDANESWIIEKASAQWLSPNPILVDAQSVLSVAVRLGERDGIFTAPGQGRLVKVQSIRRFVQDGENRFDESAIEMMGQAIAEHLQNQGFKDASVSAVVDGGSLLRFELDIEKTVVQEEEKPEDKPMEAAPPASATAKAADSKTATPSAPEDKPAEERTAEPVVTTTPMEAPAQDAKTDSEPATPSTDEPDPSVDGLPYIVDPFEVAYQYPHPELPSVESFMELTFTLGYIDTEEGGRNWIAPREGVPQVETSLNALNEGGGGVFWSTAIARITSTISRVLIDDDLLGVFVIPDPSQISSAPGSVGLDLRPADQTELTILITVGRVVESRTVARGDRILSEDQFDHDTHTAIKNASPAKPHNTNATQERSDLLRKSEISDYIHRLNRHPGRNVEASVAASAVPGGVSLDYLVFENKPLTLYYEIGNTGTPQENGLRQRFGLFHSQFTGNDDILSLQYVTSNFSTTNAVLGSYDFRITDDNKIRGAVLGSWNRFVNDQFGQDFVNYTGFSWSGGGQLDINIFQDGPLFVDLVPGVNYQKVKVNNEIIDDSGQAGFVLPYAQLQLTRQDDQGLITGMIGIEGSPLSQSNRELTLLGRFRPSEQWARLNWSGSISTFLEPLLDPVGWADPETPETSTLAHEVAARFSGQYSFGNRLVPQFQSVLGGMYSVRGYAQSVVAGDNSLFGSIEYRFHLPRTFSINPEPLQFMGSDFHAAPRHVYGRPDWDLILKGFFDAGYVFQSDTQDFEADNTLLGAGIGLEFLWKSNLRVQLDWGFALHDLKFGLAQAGSSRLYVTGTFLW
ncbi:MAG: hypothetical protein CMJ40_05575 [Phycisphaerae bacterium]|nr:hypothetical protein [Phycisphaerae bacterium]